MLRRVAKTKEGIPKKYLPKSLSPEDRKKQLESIKKGTDRPKVDFRPKRSSHCEKFEKKYGFKISNLNRVYKEIISKKGVDEIKKKGIGAYYSGGSRPNQTPESWWKARLCSVIMNGKARKVDMDIWLKYKL
jgi:hypothetical protein